MLRGGESEEGRKREKENIDVSNIGPLSVAFRSCLLYASLTRSNPQPRYVPYLGSNLSVLGRMLNQLNHFARPKKKKKNLCKKFQKNKMNRLIFIALQSLSERLILDVFLIVGRRGGASPTLTNHTSFTLDHSQLDLEVAGWLKYKPSHWIVKQMDTVWPQAQLCSM